VDPSGEWSFSIGFYWLWGGELTFGVNPDGKKFFSIKLGAGVGGGFSINPDGTSSNYNPNGCYNSGAGFNFGLGMDLPFTNVGYEAAFGAMTGQKDIPSSLYTSKGLNVGFGFDRGGLKASANISGEFIFIFNKGK